MISMSISGGELRKSCRQEKLRLLYEAVQASGRYSDACRDLEILATTTSAAEYKRLADIAELERVRAKLTRIAFERHCAEHRSPGHTVNR